MGPVCLLHHRPRLHGYYFSPGGVLYATEEQATPTGLDAELADLVDGDSTFAFGLYKNLTAEEKGTSSSRPTASHWPSP